MDACCAWLHHGGAGDAGGWSLQGSNAYIHRKCSDEQNLLRQTGILIRGKCWYLSWLVTASSWLMSTSDTKKLSPPSAGVCQPDGPPTGEHQCPKRVLVVRLLQQYPHVHPTTYLYSIHGCME